MADGHSSPSPRAWPAMLGAADMPIGCALTFYFGIAGPDPRLRPKAAGSKWLARTTPLCDRPEDGFDNYSVACRSVGLRSRCRALRPKNSA